MKILNLLVLLFICLSDCYSQVPSIQWAKAIGGNGSDFSYSVHHTSDEGFLVAGNSDYNGFWIAKLDNNGDTLWTKKQSGTCNEGDHTILETADGGIVFAGQYNTDFEVQKLNSAGTTLWSRSYGGNGSEYIHTIDQTSDGGFILGGASNSNDGDVTGNHGSFDYWIVKTDSIGNLQWQKSFGGSGIDNAYSVQETFDHGYIIAGTTISNNGDVSGNHGNYDYWVIKTDVYGVIQWQKTYGGSGDDELHSLCLTSDSGYVVTGGSKSSDGDVSGHHADSDFWILKLNASGDTLWTRTYGGSGFDDAKSVKQTVDGGFIVAGQANSMDGDVHGVTGGSGFWLVKLSSLGDTVWTKVLGGTEIDGAESVQQTSDGGYVVAGWTSSFPVSGIYFDYWIVKLLPENTSIQSVKNDLDINIYPNPTTGEFYVKARQLKCVEVYSLKGELVQFFIGTNNISLNNLAHGSYLLRLITDLGVIYKEVIYE